MLRDFLQACSFHGIDMILMACLACITVSLCLYLCVPCIGRWWRHRWCRRTRSPGRWRKHSISPNHFDVTVTTDRLLYHTMYCDWWFPFARLQRRSTHKHFDFAFVIVFRGFSNQSKCGKTCRLHFVLSRLLPANSNVLLFTYCVLFP